MTMARLVPLARRNLFQERRRALLATGGVAVALLLVLLLDGSFAGAMRQVTAYLDDSPADAIISQAGVRTMHMSASALPPATVDRARAVPGVAWAEPIRYASGLLTSQLDRQLAYLNGYRPGRPAGRAAPADRRPPTRPPGGAGRPGRHAGRGSDRATAMDPQPVASGPRFPPVRVAQTTHQMVQATWIIARPPIWPLAVTTADRHAALRWVGVDGLGKAGQTVGIRPSCERSGCERR
jgi:hypothetical protein